jgi:hypothetical protein
MLRLAFGIVAAVLFIGAVMFALELLLDTPVFQPLLERAGWW